jgi:hypothetical protein
VTVTDLSDCTSLDSAVVRSVAGITETTISHVRIYPNPAQGSLYIENRNATEKIDQIELLDMDGRAIQTYQAIEGTTTKLYFDDAARGIYLLHLHTPSGKELRQKVVLL